jgi:hypothetical protein
MPIPMPAPAPAPRPFLPPSTPGGFHGAVTEFKRRLIEATLCQWGGNRTRSARALGLQRTYLLRLIREFDIHVPRPGLPGGSQSTNGDGQATNGSVAASSAPQGR